MFCYYKLLDWNMTCLGWDKFAFDGVSDDVLHESQNYLEMRWNGWMECRLLGQNSKAVLITIVYVHQFRVFEQKY